MPELRVVGREGDGSLVVIMGLVKLGRGHVQIDVATVEVDGGVVRVQLLGLVEVCLSIVELVHMVVGKATVVIVDSRATHLNRLVIVGQRILPVSVLELRQGKVVES